MTTGNTGRIYRLKVELAETEPLIWRRIAVPSGITLHRLHLILQDAMGWTNSHLYRFEVEATEFAEPNPDNEFYELPFKNSKRVKLDQLVVDKGAQFIYEYDFGDSWKHRLILEDITESEYGKHYPTCLAGERSCPPEDCGGVHGYAELLGIICNPDNEQFKDMMTWLGGSFAPSVFNINVANRKLHLMRFAGRGRPVT